MPGVRPKPPAPEDPSPRLKDPTRLQAVRSLGLLDTPPEEVFDRMTRLAATIMGVPASFISLVEEDRDFYKSQFGMPEPVASERQLAGRTFCHYTLHSDVPLALDDVIGLAVFEDVPTVRRFGIRSYLGVPLRTAEGHNIGSLCAIDVKPHHWSEQDVNVLSELAHSAMREIELRRALRDLRAADQRKDLFVATMAHELRQPLAALLPAIGLLCARASETSTKRATDVITRQVKQLQHLVDDLLDVAGIAARKIVLHRERSDLAQILRGAVDSLRPLAEQRAQALEIVSPVTPVWVDADSARLHQVFSNLITNAIKYTQTGGTIDVTLAVDTPSSIVTVRDNGRGIAPEALPQIFDLFMQEGTNERAGLGIGLNLARGLVDLHGGTVEARSDGRDRGSAFTITLPLAS
jgi:signal transduction histidine kinase